MKIYTSPNSPFGSRLTIGARAKGLEITPEPLPRAGLKSAEYLAINPIAKIPVLVTDAGTVIPESEVILDYLEDRYPTPSLRPDDPEHRAQVNLLIRIVDNYVMAPVIRCFTQLDPDARDDAVVAGELRHWKAGLAALAHFFDPPLPQAEAGLTLADCALPPALHLSERIARLLGIGEDLLQPHAALREYYAQISSHPVVGPVLDDLTRAQAAYDEARGRH